MYRRLFTLAKRAWPELSSMSIDRQVIGVGEVFGLMYTGPLALAGLIWLARSTDLDVLRANPLMLAVFAGLAFLFYRLNFYLIVELRTNRYGSSDGSMVGVVLMSAALILGPTALWLTVIWISAQYVVTARHYNTPAEYWNGRRNYAMALAGETVVPLVALWAYTAVGGQIPLPNLDLDNVLLAIVALLAYVSGYSLLYVPYFMYSLWVQKYLNPENPAWPLVRFYLLAIGLPYFALPFSILAAGLYVQNGVWVYLFFMAGMLVVAYLARRLSLAVESSRQQSRLLEKLEELSRAVIDSPVNANVLPELLERYVPNMFPSGKIALWRFPDQLMFRNRQDWQPDFEHVWPWLLKQRRPHTLPSKETLPWQESYQPHNPTIVAPIMDVESGQAYAGVLLELHTLAQPWSRRSLAIIASAVQSLADLVASALRQSEMAAQTLELDRMAQELRLAGDIQASLLPYSFPTIPGWQLSVLLTPAGDMAGDFFDIIPLSEGKIGIVIADVLDKGFGPALYMALSRTLIRTYATEFELSPDTVFFAANERILNDTRANLFVTAFYGILDPATGALTYSNAGHNPPYLFSRADGRAVQTLGRTGIPIGIDEDATWEHASVQLEPGDCLLLYTDGIPDASNMAGEFFEEGKLVEVVKQSLGRSAEEIQTRILGEIRQFVGDAPPTDDITLMVLIRDT